jgi:acyl-CoA synthetase (NDP forming)
MNTIRSFLEENRGKTRFLEHEVKSLLRDAGLSVPKGIFLARGETLAESHGLTYPLAAKVSSEKISGKSDVKGVMLDITDIDELKRAVEDLLRIENSEGVLIEEMAPQGLEVIIGGVVDAQFGPIVMFGLGGVFVELFRDVAFGLAPLSEEEALRLVMQVKGSRLLKGYRGKPSLDVGSLLKVIVTVSEMIASGLLEEIDLNPVAIYQKGATVLDAKMSARLIRKQ